MPSPVVSVALYSTHLLPRRRAANGSSSTGISMKKIQNIIDAVKEMGGQFLILNDEEK